MNLEDFVKVSKARQSGAAGSDEVKEEKPDHGEMEEPRDMDQGINRNSVLTVTALEYCGYIKRASFSSPRNCLR